MRSEDRAEPHERATDWTDWRLTMPEKLRELAQS